MTLTAAIFALLAAVIAALAGLAGAVYGARKTAATNITIATADDQREDTQTNDARWQAMLESQRKDFDLVLEPIRTEIRDLRTEVATLSAALDTVRRVKNAAVEHIRRLIVWAHSHAPGVELPPLPDILTDEV
ncbi:MAG: hypothetical protein EOO27_11695 [Comamonadaceae bacterium]|nr:MAG: hypothetical protein EOO27_11695 [Comamonadaceae bacterium]